MYGSEQEINEIYLHENEIESEGDLFEAERSHKVTSSIASLALSAVAAVPDPNESEFITAFEAMSLNDNEVDVRPYLFDKKSGSHLLLDTGAQVTAYPPEPGDVPDPRMTLRAVNGSQLKCYGYKDVVIQINRKTYDIRAIKTDVAKPVIGYNFVRKHRLVQDWSEFGDALLVDKKSNIRATLKYRALPKVELASFSSLRLEQSSAPSDSKFVSGHAANKLVFELSSLAALEEETSAIINDLNKMPQSEYKELLKKVLC